MTPKSDVAIETAGRLWAQAAGDSTNPGEVAAAAEQVCGLLRVDLERWIGAEGYQALLDRALVLTRVDHPALTGLTCLGQDGAAMAAAVKRHGADEMVAALVALVAALIGLLGRIIGEEMAVQLVDQLSIPSPRGIVSSKSTGGRDG